jgi:hypothetical protein
MRLLRSAVGLTLVAALALAMNLPAAGQGHHGEYYDKCARACSDCQRSCDSCSTHCAHLLAEGKKEHHKTLATCQDCATHCAAAASIVARKGPFSDLICKACAEACERCGKACEAFPGDKHMKQCAEECRRCEKACREMLEHTGKGKATSTRRAKEGSPSR